MVGHLQRGPGTRHFHPRRIGLRDGDVVGALAQPGRQADQRLVATAAEHGVDGDLVDGHRDARRIDQRRRRHTHEGVAPLTLSARPEAKPSGGKAGMRAQVWGQAIATPCQGLTPG